jgi:ribosomal protein S18 acetylase RimI-like enzyme
MNAAEKIKPVPWDRRALGIDCFELADAAPGTLAAALARPGHYSVRIDPLDRTAKADLQRHGFYYCDTLIEPWCTRSRLRPATDPDAALDTQPDLDAVLAICHGAFSHDRFHRDFAVTQAQADARYDHWLRELHAAGAVRGLMHGGVLVGFVASQDTRLVLHAMSEAARGHGRAHALWSLVCAELFAAGAQEVSSSISAANLAAVNLYAALGFRFRNPVDLYHRVVT